MSSVPRPLKIACTEQINAGDLELGRRHRADVTSNAVFARWLAQTLAISNRGDQPVRRAAVIDAFAD